MVAELVLIVYHFMSLLHVNSNGEARNQMRVVEVERLEGVGGVETIW